MKSPRILVLCVLFTILIIFTSSCANKGGSPETRFGTGNTAESPAEKSDTYTTIKFDDVMGADYPLMYENPEAQTLIYDENSVRNQNHPIIHSYKLHSEDIKLVIVLGGSNNGKWIRPADFEIISLKDNKVIDDKAIKETAKGYPADVHTDLASGSEAFFVYSNHYETTISGKGGTKLHFNSHLNDWQLHFGVEEFGPDNEFVIGYHGDWNALPRLPKRIGNGIYELDIDNDGNNETITVEFVSKSQDIVYSRLYVETQNEKVLVSEMEVMKEYLDTYILYTLDLNGDGKMELIQFAYGFLDEPEVFEMKDSSFQKVF